MSLLEVSTDALVSELRDRHGGLLIALIDPDNANDPPMRTKLFGSARDVAFMLNRLESLVNGFIAEQITEEDDE